ncbi:MAG: hydrogenase maturation nickel metallochaperone HypA [Isosphaeraceae bacterium]
MHEIGVMSDALAIALERAERHGARKIHRIHLRVGSLSGVDPEALALAFEVVQQGSIALGATLDVETIPLACACPSCGLEFTPPDFDYQCPGCDFHGAEVIRGRELELASLETS